MREKKIIMVIMFFVLSTISYGKGFLGINGNLFFPSDKDYKEVYGNSMIYPELEIIYSVKNNIFLFGGYGYFSKTGKTIGDLKEDAKSSRGILSFGAGYDIELNEKTDILVKFGIARIGYKEEAMEVKKEGNKIGFLMGAEFMYKIGERFFTKLTVGYMNGKDKIDEVNLNLGGFKTGIGIGLRF
jgi:hypothetical protein